ncbi:ABC transporter B family member 19-like protein [Trifolium pratense]|uniref:ABC transporter B family member 19-like protein n=1 Tax=Trifolium pratense TaxID=57577 RepID=A0A2K3N8M3_TRIPR|nr:ABC transporter B family member 19-like protein [Trifolium pratense]
MEEEDGHDGDEMMKNVVRAVPFLKLLSYADYVDWILMGLGTLGSIVHGMALPVGYLLLGKALNAFGNNIHDIDAMVPALKKVEHNENSRAAQKYSKPVGFRVLLFIPVENYDGYEVPRL